MSFRPIAIGFAALALPFTAVACGGDDDNNSGSRPSVAEISTAFSKELPSSVPNAQEISDCVAGKLHTSDLPNGVLRKLVAGEEAEVDKDNEDKYTEIVTESATECATEVTTGAAGN